MATRRPLVLINGRTSELPVGDTVAGTGEGGGTGVTTFMQTEDPLAPSPYLWYKTDATGAVIDILKG